MDFISTSKRQQPSRRISAHSSTNRFYQTNSVSQPSSSHQSSFKTSTPLPSVISKNSTTRESHQNPLRRLSEQLRRIQPPPTGFKTLNTPSLLRKPKVAEPVLDAASELHRYDGKMHHAHHLQPLRSLNMPSEISKYQELLSKTLQSQPSFSSKMYFQQHWHNKERGGPISRKHSAEGQSLIQRYRTRNKTQAQTPDTSLQAVHRTIDYQQQCKEVLDNWRSCD